MSHHLSYVKLQTQLDPETLNRKLLIGTCCLVQECCVGQLLVTHLVHCALFVNIHYVIVQFFLCDIQHYLGQQLSDLLSALSQWRADAVGCPGPTRLLDALKLFPKKFLKYISFFSHMPKNFDFQHQFSNFTNIFPLYAPQCCIIPGNDILLFIFQSFTCIFLKENWLLGCPPGWMPGAVGPSAPPLHATALSSNI